LLTHLNNAIEILSEAEIAYSNGDVSTAAIQAANVIQIADDVTVEAQEVQAAASISRQQAFWSAVIITSVSVVVFVLALFLVWRRLKQNYVDSLSSSKPEVSSDET
jgi:ABC-type Fe3+-siderophore transport system permease subunit